MTIAPDSVEGDAHQKRVGEFENEDLLNDVHRAGDVSVAIEEMRIARDQMKINLRQAKSDKTQQPAFGMFELPGGKEQQHDCVEAEFNLQRPVDAIDGADVEQPLDHRKIRHGPASGRRAAWQMREM